MSRISEVLRNKNKVQKLQRKRQKDEIDTLRGSAQFKAHLHEELKKIEVLFDSSEVDYVIIEVPDVNLAKFGEAIYSEDLAEYDIEQAQGTHNNFLIRRKFISF